MSTQREQFEARALPIFKDNPTWRESGDCELAWHFWQAAQAQQAAVETTSDVGACNTHPDAPHGFDRNASHMAGRYVYDCEGWTPVEQEAAVPKMVTPYITQEHFDRSFPVQAAVEPVAYVDDAGALEPTMHGVITLKCGDQLYTTPPDHTAAMRAALDALLKIQSHEVPDADVDASIAQLRAQLGEQ